MAGNDKKLIVMVVDDDPLVRNLLNAVLNDARIELHEAPDGKSALDLAREVKPDVVLLDVMMPGMDGYATCRAMRDDVELRTARILILTARSRPEDREEAMHSGADAFFTKPFSPLELIDAILESAPGAA